MKPVELTKDVYWVGALDSERRVFDVLFETPRGTSYNAYLIKGEKVALIDTVKATFTEEFLAKVGALVPWESIAYVVVNHTEPDHSGALARLLQGAKNARVVISRNAGRFLEHLLNTDVHPIMASDDTVIDLGGKTLRFVIAPFLHWPDTMFTYLVEDKILFPCDAFSCHVSDERLFNDLVPDFEADFRTYFQDIMRPFKEQVRQAVDKVKVLDLEVIAPSHGPVLRRDPWHYVYAYAEWAQHPQPGPRKTVLVFYASAYGNTQRMAEEVARGAAIDGVDVHLYETNTIEAGSLLDWVEAADAIIVGSPTICGDVVKPIWDLLSSLATIRLRGKMGAAFGSYGWSGEAVDMLNERLRGLKFKVPVEGVKAHFVPTEQDLAACRELGRQVATSLLS